jgi:uncharacterized lipoprotein YbaY
VASDVITAPGQVPISYSISYTNANIDQSLTYTVQAAIVDGDRAWGTGTGTPVITKGNPTSGVDLDLVYRADLLKGAVTGSITGVDIELGAEAYSAAVLLDHATDTTVGIDVQVAPSGVPIAFSIPFDPATIDQGQTYVVGAGIVDGEERWENRPGVPVITNGNPLSGVTVPVAAVVPPDADDGLGPLGWIVGAIGLLALAAAVILFVRSRRPPEPEPADAALATTTGEAESAESAVDAEAEAEAARATAQATEATEATEIAEATETTEPAEVDATSGWTTETPAADEPPPTWGEGDSEGTPAGGSAPSGESPPSVGPDEPKQPQA